MAKNLVIVESPSKSKTIEKYLGSDYKVVSSKGHIRDLATSGKFGLGVDIENHFKPNYINITGKAKVITDLKKDAKAADKVYLASDPDREGEAISWHLYDALGLKESEYERVVFNEITKNTVTEAFNHTRKIDMKMVNSQEARRILDRIIGFRLSKLMQSKTGGKSAGRVQSVALKLIVDKEREIEKFVIEDYYEIDAFFKEFGAKLEKYKDEEIEIKTEEEANRILGELSKAFTIENIETKKKAKKSKAPFITSSLQQEASSKLYFNASKTMRIAQKLYEGVDLADETVGLITYMRTDSIRLSDEFVGSTFHYIEENYGKEYIGYPKQSKKKENVQDAHEAIRPTSIKRTPESVKPYLSDDEYKLYKLIYFRALASLMKDAAVEQTTVILDNNDYKFKTTGQVLVYDGYLKVYKEYEDSEDKILPPFDKYNSKVVVAEKIESSLHHTKPPARYTEAKLIKELEELGIGRPSTYAKIVETLRERNYVDMVDKKFHPTEVGFEITDKLQEFFSSIINVKYTANMEEELDEIAEGDLVWYELIEEFFNEFEPLVENAFDKMEKKAPEETGEMCPECGNPLVKRKGKYGEFVACSNYPNCKYIKQDEKKIIEIIDCPICEGKIVEKKTKKGKLFYGCNNYPSCNYALWDKPTGSYCPECNGILVAKSKKIKCVNCDFEKGQ